MSVRKPLLLSLSLCSLFSFAQMSRLTTDRETVFVPQAAVQLVQTGTRSMYPQGLHIPLWAIMSGDTTMAERLAHRFNSCGPHGLDATLWTRAEHGRPWVRTSYRRPKDAEEAMALRHDPKPFTTRRHGNASILPVPFADLPERLLDRIEFIIMYDDGSAKSYLYPGISQREAEDIVAFINKTFKG